MKVKKCISHFSNESQQYCEIKSLEELKSFFVPNSETPIIDVRFEELELANDTQDKFSVQVLFNDDDAYWTVGVSDTNKFDV